jgi:hypothetical protein
MGGGMSNDPRDIWNGRYLSAGYEFAAQCAALRETNPFKHPALEEIIVYLATELWDQGFSQTEIRSAFEKAVSDLVPYAAGEERRGDSER